MKELVFLLEEPSAKAMLESLLPRMLCEEIHFRCIPFEGKQDLERQLTRKIRGYRNERARFIVLRDQDSHPDCKVVKARLLNYAKHPARRLVAWFVLRVESWKPFTLAICRRWNRPWGSGAWQGSNRAENSEFRMNWAAPARN